MIKATGKIGLVLAVFFVCALVAGAVIWQQHSPIVDNSVTMTGDNYICDQDAKVCPDGSVVGRIGPNCEFSACPGVMPVQPIIDSFNDCVAAGNPVMESYPRQCRAGDRTFVEKITVPSHTSQSYDTSFTMTINQTVTFPDGMELTLAGIDDSRCKPDVQCIWAGELKGVFHLVINGHGLSREVELGALSNREETVGDYTFIYLDATTTSMILRVHKQVTTQETGKINGIVMLGPVCPVERDPPDPDCADKPYATDLVLTNSDGSGIVQAFRSDEQGKFSITVKPGTYSIHSSVENTLPRCSSQDTIVVKDNANTQVTVYCDSGIR